MAETRRDRVRAATTREITQTARRILVEEGPDAVTLRAIAREMGMTAPALYRYFDSHQELLRQLIGDIFLELADDLRAAIMAVPMGDMSGKFMAAAREFRLWALSHEREYAMIFGTPMPALDRVGDDFVAECGARLGWTFLSLFLDLWRKSPFPVAPDDEIPERLRGQLARYREGLGADLPLGTLLAFLQCWTRLYGSVTLEAFGHLAFALDEPAAMFEMMLGDVMPRLGLVYTPPPEAPTPADTSTPADARAFTLADAPARPTETSARPTEAPATRADPATRAEPATRADPGAPADPAAPPNGTAG